MSVAGSERVLNAQITSSVLVGSISSSTTIEYRAFEPPAEQLTGSDTNSTLQQLVGALDGAFGGSASGR